MKNVLAAFALLMLSLGAIAQSEMDFNVEINGETTRYELMEIRNELGQKGFDFQYQPRFNNDRQLVGISLKVVQIDGTLKAAYKTDELQSGDVVRIKRDTATDAAVPFCVGSCGE